MSLTKTRWKIESGRIIIRPFGLLFVLSSVLAVIFAALFIAFQAMGQANVVGSVPFAGFLLVVFALFFMGGFTYILFDRNTGRMSKMLFGFIPVKNVPFDQLHGINIVTQRAGGFNYRMFTKSDKFGKGTVISSGYSKDTDPNAVAFNNEVVSLIHQYLDAVSPLQPETVNQIMDYQYFTESGGVYTLKMNKAGLLILGFACLALGIHECTPAAWLNYLSVMGKLLVTGFPILLGIVFVAAAFTKITFDTGARIVERKSPIGLGNQRHPFGNFINFQTVRKSYNGIYSGTEVIMYFQAQDGKTKGLLLSSFRNTRKIERLMQEIGSIMK